MNIINNHFCCARFRNTYYFMSVGIAKHMPRVHTHAVGIDCLSKINFRRVRQAESSRHIKRSVLISLSISLSAYVLVCSANRPESFILVLGHKM